MSTFVIPRTYRLPKTTEERIRKFALHQKISQSKAIEKLTTLAILYMEEKAFEAELEKMSKNKNLMKESLEWAKVNLN